MRKWTKLLPYFIIEWYAKRYMERWQFRQDYVYAPGYDVVVVRPLRS